MPPEWILDAEFEGFMNAFGHPVLRRRDERLRLRTDVADGDPFGEDRPERVQVLVHPGLWTPKGRPIVDLVVEPVEERYDRTNRYVDGYVEAA